MGFHVNEAQFSTWLTEQQNTYDVYAPKCFSGGDTFSDVDCIRYGKVNSIPEIVFDQKREYSFKEVLTRICQMLFFFTEEQCKEADLPKKASSIKEGFLCWTDARENPGHRRSSKRSVPNAAG